MVRIGLLCAAVTLATPTSATAASTAQPQVAALQVALRAEGLYAGTVDGLPGPSTANATVAFQRLAGLVPDGIPGPRTRRALGRLGRPSLGSRRLAPGAVGWDVAELQFLLARRGFPSGPFDGKFGSRLESAVRRFQRYSRLPQIGVAGPRTIDAALHAPLPVCPIGLAWPVVAPLGDGFGPRGNAFHAGIDLKASAGAAVSASAAGRVVWAAPRGSFGNAVVVAHGRGVRTLYAHLATISVVLRQRVAAGAALGTVGSSGRATGPHLHFEVRVRGAAVDPLSALPH